jgi:putative ABC transport system permease protein
MAISSENIKYSLRNLKQSKSRSILTILSIFVGIASIFIFISFGLGLYYYVDDFSSESSANKLLIQAKGASAPGLDDTFKLTDDDLEVIDRVPEVFVATGSSMAVAEIQKGNEKRYVFISSYDPKKPIIWDLSKVGVFSGREVSPGETKKAVMGYNFLIEDKIFSEGLELNDNFEIGGNKTKIIGFMEAIGNPQDDSGIYITQEYFDELYPARAGNYGWIIAEVDIDKIDKIAEDIEKALRKERGLEEGKEDFYVQSFEELLESFSSVLNLIIGFVILIALISVVVSAVNTANTMITSVLERRKEIGIIKAVGAKNSEILKIFLFESAVLGFVAGTIGVIVGYLVSSAAGSILDSLGWGFLSPHYSPILFISLVVFSTLTGAFSGVFPAMRASKLNVVDALRYE